MLINFDNSSLVATSVAIVRSTKKSKNIVFMAWLDPFHNKLVCSGYLFQIVDMIEFNAVILTESIACSSRTGIKTKSIIRITP